MKGEKKTLQIVERPTADVVEVVRCRDCVHWGGVTYGFVCRKFSGIDTKICMGADHYCSYGEKKANNDKRREYKKAWNAKNPEKVKASRKKTNEKRKNNPDYIARERAYHAEWQKKNADKWNAYLREYRKKKKRNCTKCKHFVGCEQAYNGICALYEEGKNER